MKSISIVAALGAVIACTLLSACEDDTTLVPYDAGTGDAAADAAHDASTDASLDAHDAADGD